MKTNANMPQYDVLKIAGYSYLQGYCTFAGLRFFASENTQPQTPVCRQARHFNTTRWVPEFINGLSFLHCT